MAYKLSMNIREPGLVSPYSTGPLNMYINLQPVSLMLKLCIYIYILTERHNLLVYSNTLYNIIGYSVTSLRQETQGSGHEKQGELKELGKFFLLSCL